MMKTSPPLKIAVLAGDGIGQEVTQAALPVFAALNIPVALTMGDIGWSYWQKEGHAIPERTWALINDSDTTLVGAITSKPEREAHQELAKELHHAHLNYVSPIILLRQKLDLFANVRPCFSLNKKEEPFNFCIIRENTEGLYAGFDYHPVPAPLNNLIRENKSWSNTPAADMSCALRIQTKTGLTRLFRFAFAYAEKHRLQRVTFADKPNVLRHSGHFARTIFEAIAAHYPQIKADILNVDAVGLWLVKRPQQFGVIVAENMFGDILSDVGAGVMGGLGLAPSANIGAQKCYFEPVHGSAPTMKKNAANPAAMFLTISMLLDQFGYQHQAASIRNAVASVIDKGRFLTYDLGGHACTTDMAHAIIDACLKKEGTKKIMRSPLDILQQFNTTELADALDACGVEGALLHIKPLKAGMKIIGPAYTVRYSSYEAEDKVFKNAANYIDAVPEHSVVVIDNNGRPDCTVWGALLTQMALHKNLAGTIIHGSLRDVAFIRDSGYPVFCSGIYMRSGKNRVQKISEQSPLMIHNTTINPGDIIFADDNGALVLPQHLLNTIIQKAEKIKLTEERISTAIKEGISMEQARADYRYDQPWLGANK